MSTTSYAILFEVRLLWDYVLTANNTSYFDPNLDEEDRQQRLANTVQNNFWDFRQDLLVKPTQKTMKFLKAHRLLLKTGPFGFFVVGEVKQVKGEDGDVVLKPRIPCDPDASMHFDLYALNPFFKRHSAVPMLSGLPAKYFFNNYHEAARKVYPNLVLPVDPFVSGQEYEMGQYADFNGELYEATETTSNDAPWQKTSGEQLVSQNDQFILPKKFNYSLSQKWKVTEVSAQLQSADGTVLLKLDFTSNELVRQIQLDCTTDADGNSLSDGSYTLVIQSGDVLIEEATVWLDDALFNPDAWATISLTMTSTNEEFNLIDPDQGTLVRKEHGVSSSVSHPLFELPLKSRLSYWRYYADEPFDDETISEVRDYLMISDPEDHSTLVSLAPKASALNFIQFGNEENLMIANPDEMTTLKYEKGRYYSDIKISSINPLLNS